MKHSEWLETCALVSNLWPSQPWSPSTAAASYELFEKISARQAREAVRLLAEDGLKFAPPPGVVLKTARSVIDTRLALPDVDLVRDLTPEELGLNQKRGAKLRECIAGLADQKRLERPGEFRIKLAHSNLPRERAS